MKKTILALAMVSAASFALATQPGVATSAAGIGQIGISNSVSGSFNFNGMTSGTSYSAATNSQAASATLNATAATTTGLVGGHMGSTTAAGLTGSTTASGSASAYNISTGNGQGVAQSTGQDSAAVGGGLDATSGITIGGVQVGNGFSTTAATNDIQASTNTGSYSNSTSVGGFGVDATITSAVADGYSNIDVASNSTGYAGGTQSSGPMTTDGEAMTAAPTTSVTNAGQFGAEANISASIEVAANTVVSNAIVVTSAPVGQAVAQGATGANGIAGTNGINGVDGIGIAGAAGKDGIDGVDGIGIAGKDGIDGVNGQDGAAGSGTITITTTGDDNEITVNGSNSGVITVATNGKDNEIELPGSNSGNITVTTTGNDNNVPKSK